jgi:hypothetical protein
MYKNSISCIYFNVMFLYRFRTTYIIDRTSKIIHLIQVSTS